MSKDIYTLIANERNTKTGKLYLSNFRLTQIPSEIQVFSWLNFLDIGTNNISRLENLPGSLESLLISYNNISKLENLPTTLRALYINSNQICKLENLPEGLKTLYINSNQIIKLENLPKNLKYLHIESNRIQKLENLPQGLTSLIIGSNQISKLENLSASLNSLDISSNQISDLNYLKREIVSRRYYPVWNKENKSNELVLNNNPLTIPPPEIIRRGSWAVIQYFQELDEEDARYLYEAKVLVVGDARVGKTTLCGKLKNISTPLLTEKDSTKGIDIFSLSFESNEKTISANIWDFGGQEIYHSTHQFFLTKRSLYIFVDDNSRDDIEYDYWFQAIELLSKSSPVIVVQNKKADRHKAFDDRGFKSRFKNLKDTFSINLALETEKDKQEFERLKNAIQYELSNLPHIGQILPKQWVEIREEVGKRALSQPTITLKEYNKICSGFTIKKQDSALNLSNYLHDLGVFLHFQDDDLLRKTIILQKEWATNAVYKILDDKDITAKQGRFCKKDAINIWKDSDYQEMYAEFLNLMKTFELIYTLSETDGKEFLIPKLLPIEQPEFDWDYEDNIQMKYEYDFMPKGLISRFIVRQHRYISDLKFIWRRGVILEREGAKALVIENYINKKIEVWVRGIFARDLLTIIKDDFDRLHGQFEGLKVQKKIPCNCSKCEKSEKPFFYDYDSLIRRIKNKKETVECDISYEDVSVKGLIEGVFSERVLKDAETEETTREKKLKATRIFISYSKEENNIKEEFIKHLSTLKYNNYISAWDDGMVEPGKKWDDEIKNNLKKSDIVIFMVSHNLLSTKYVMEVELPETIKRVKEGEQTLVPVILDYCDWKDSPLGQYQSANDKAVELTSFENINEGFLQVITNLKQIIKPNNC